MQPTAEQIAAMEERGWAWDGRRFAARAGVAGAHSLTFPLHATVRHHGDGWLAFYGAASHDWSSLEVSHPDPLAAADEAEAWLRGLLSQLRFPWLRVGG